MRIRQVRPEFWTDETMAALSAAVRLFYIGLWDVADDAGWLSGVRADRRGAVSVRVSEEAGAGHCVLVGAAAEVGRLVVHDCGCAEIPTLPRHQRVSGKQSFTAKELAH